MKITSAHAIAFTALVVSVGGGLAVGHNGDTDKVHFCIPNGGGTVTAVQPELTCPEGSAPQDIRVQNVGYQEANIGAAKYPAGKTRLVSKQLFVPADGQSYLLSGKAVVSSAGSRVTVTCRLSPTDNTPADVARATLRPGDSQTLAFETFGKTDGREGQTAAAEISCRSIGGAFRAAQVRVTAVPVNTVSKGVPVS
jgi:hypothetical protein